MVEIKAILLGERSADDDDRRSLTRIAVWRVLFVSGVEIVLEVVAVRRESG